MDYSTIGLIAGIVLMGVVVYIALATELRDPLLKRYDRGLAHLDEGRYDEAILEFTTITDLDPLQSAAYYDRGLAYRRKGEYET